MFSVCSMMLMGCDSLFYYHPYDTRFDGETNINKGNISRIEDAEGELHTLELLYERRLDAGAIVLWTVFQHSVRVGVLGPRARTLSRQLLSTVED